MKVIPELTEKDLARFWKKVDVRGPDDCWEWTAGSTSNGYGSFGMDCLNYYAHRISYAIANDDPGKLCVCHTCDNRLCVNPNHLWLGTIQADLKDRDEKDRQAKGEQQGLAKLTEKQVKEILESNEPQQVLADRFGVSRENISDIKCGKTWKHLEGGCAFKSQTGARGITLHDDKYRARTMLQGKTYHLGTFDTINKAKQVLDNWKSEHDYP